MMHISDRITSGDASHQDLQLLDNVAHNIQGKCLCALGEFATMAVVSGIERFKNDFELRVLDAKSQAQPEPVSAD